MKKLPMSVVIPVSKDIKIGQCLKSIDLPIEIVVVLNNQPSKEVIEIVEKDNRCHRIYVISRGCNLARVFNVGINAATNEKIVLTNSDCIFPPGLLEKIFFHLDKHEVVKTQVNFFYNNYPQYLVAGCRRLFHQVFDNGTKLFGPGLAFKKEIQKKIGGYFFNEKVQWGEDGELSKRIHAANLDCLILDEKISHDGVSMIYDLRIAFRIGRGNRATERFDGISLLRAFIDDIRHLITDHHQQFRIAYKEGGCRLFLYFFFWKVAFHLGYYTEK